MTQDPVLRYEARDGVILDTRLVRHLIVNPAQGPKDDLVTGPIKFIESIVGQVGVGP